MNIIEIVQQYLTVPYQYKVRRASWPTGRSIYTVLDWFGKDDPSHLCIRMDVRGDNIPFMPDPEDILADDWELTGVNLSYIERIRMDIEYRRRER